MRLIFESTCLGLCANRTHSLKHTHTRCSPSPWGCWKVNLHNHIRGKEGGAEAKGPGEGHRLLWHLRESDISQVGCVTYWAIQFDGTALLARGAILHFGGTRLKLKAFAPLRWAGRRQLRTGDPALETRESSSERRSVDYLPSLIRSSHLHPAARHF